VSETGERLAWGWVAHLREGGTTTWRDWRVAATAGAETHGRYLPGAQQLELLRRLNLEGRPSAELAQRVLGASAPGRGTPDLQLVGAAEESAFGPRPIEPLDLPDAELTRVATGLIAENVVAVGLPPEPGPATLRPWRRRYRLVGDPWLADPVRAELIRRGRPPGSRGATVYVLGTDLATMLSHAWTIRSFSDGGPGWSEWLGRFAGSPRVPPRVDLVAAARTWERRVGGSRVAIVLEPSLLPRLLGVRRRLPTRPTYSADAVDLARRVGAALGLLVLPYQRTRLLLEGLGLQLVDAPGRPLAIPAEHAEWVQRRAVRMRDAVLSAGYAVHGDPAALVPRADSDVLAPAAGSEPDDARVLALALRLLLDSPMMLEKPTRLEVPTMLEGPTMEGEMR
jgi:hypothetical protein